MSQAEQGKLCLAFVEVAWGVSRPMIFNTWSWIVWALSSCIEVAKGTTCLEDINWFDNKLSYCSQYTSLQYCTLDGGYGIGHSSQVGTWQDRANPWDNSTAADVCCSCGGGVQCEVVPNWVDANGNDCAGYQEWCTSGAGYGDGQKSSAEVKHFIRTCCACGFPAYMPDLKCTNAYMTTQAEVEEFAKQNCTSVKGEFFFFTDVEHVMSLRHLKASEKLRVEATSKLTSLDGLQNLHVTTQLQFGWNSALRRLSELGSVHSSNLERLEIEGNPELESIAGALENLQEIGNMEIVQNSNLQTLAPLGSLTKAKWVRLGENAKLKSLHGLEKLARITSKNPCYDTSSCNGASLEVFDMPELESLNSLASLEGSLLGEVSVEKLPRLSNLQGLQGIEGICTAPCGTAFTVSQVGQGPWESAMSSDFCFPSEQRAAFLQMIGGLNYALPDSEWNQSNCHYCPQPCGNLPSGYPVQCDYEVGRCGCPLGTVGENCSLTAPTVRIVPGQAKQCVKPYLQEGQSAPCTICIDVMTGDYAFDLLNPPTSFEIRESGNSGILSGAQQNVEWQNATHGSVCMIIPVFASEVSTGSQALNLVLGYTKFAQDCLLPGTLRSPLLNPVQPMYPWCLDSGDCTSTSVEAGLAILEIQEPPVGQPRFAESEHVFDEGSLGSLVLSREGGNYSALTTTVRINATLSSAVAGVNYEFQDAVVSWPHLDSTPKSIAITFPDNNIFEANPSLTLHLVPSVQIGGQILLGIADNGDGGLLGFTSQRITRPETAPQSGSCLVNVRQE